MPVSTEVAIGPGDIVLDGVPALHPYPRFWEDPKFGGVNIAYLSNGLSGDAY